MVSLNGHGIKSNFLSHVLLNREMGMIHSIFNNSFNLLFREQLVHIGKEREGVSAFGFTLPEQLVDRIIQAGEVGNRVIWDKGFFTIYTRPQVFEIDTSEFQVADCRVPVVSIIPPLLLGKILSLPFAENTDVLLSERNRLMAEKFVTTQMDDSAFQRHFIRHFIGRGQGLTPSGDDLLMGILIGVQAFGGSKDWVELLEKQLCAVQTTYVSHAYYEALLEGYTSSHFVHLLQAISRQEWGKWDSLIENISKYGHTSGWDTLFGLYLYFENQKGERNS